MKHYLKQFAKSIWFDVLGVVLVVGIAIYSGYLGTRLDKFVDWGWITPYIPLGFISVVNVGLSMMSTRLTGRINNWGNIVGIINVFLSGCIDFILGNKAAPIHTQLRSLSIPQLSRNGVHPKWGRQKPCL